MNANLSSAAITASASSARHNGSSLGRDTASPAALNGAGFSTSPGNRVVPYFGDLGDYTVVEKNPNSGTGHTFTMTNGVLSGPS